MSSKRFAIHLTANFFGETVEEHVRSRSEKFTVGREGPLSIPVPEGWPYLVRIGWAAPNTVRILDGSGAQYVANVDKPVHISAGPVELKIAVIRQFRLRRLPYLAAAMSTLAGVFIIGQLLMSMFLVTVQGVQSCQVYCETPLGHFSAVATRGPVEKVPLEVSDRLCQCERPSANSASGGGASYPMAEYLERLLQKDYDGDEDGTLMRKDRPAGEKKNKSVYLPAGDKGLTPKMGGAEEVALTPQRLHSAPEEKKERTKKKELLANEEVGTPIQLPVEDPEDGEADAATEGEQASESKDERVAAEEESGWGVRDWYDVEDQIRDNMEIESMTRLAKRVLKINPNDPEALSILSYYQYLSEDYDEALDTYDRYISILPDEPAGYNNKALIYKRKKQYKEEEKLYRVAIDLEPDDATAVNNLAVNLGHQGRFEEALQLMKELETRTPGDPYADLHRAKIYAEMGDEDTAFMYLEKALQGMKELDTLHHIEFRQDIRLDPSFRALRKSPRFRKLLWRFYGTDAPVGE
jgi:Flp pilus assembly protein TadD